MTEYDWDTLVDAAGDRFNPLAEGEYEFVVIEAEPTVSKNSGNEMIAVSLKVASGPHRGKSPKTVYVSKPGPGTKPSKLEGAVRMFFGHLNAFGIKPETLRQHKPTMGQIASVMLGKTVSGEIGHEPYRGEMQAVIQGNLRPPQSGAVEVTSFPQLSAAEELGYGSGAAVATADDAAF